MLWSVRTCAFRHARETRRDETRRGEKRPANELLFVHAPAYRYKTRHPLHARTPHHLSSVIPARRRVLVLEPLQAPEALLAPVEPEVRVGRVRLGEVRAELGVRGARLCELDLEGFLGEEVAARRGLAGELRRREEGEQDKGWDGPDDRACDEAGEEAVRGPPRSARRRDLVWRGEGDTNPRLRLCLRSLLVMNPLRNPAQVPAATPVRVDGERRRR